MAGGSVAESMWWVGGWVGVENEINDNLAFN